jgi:hypothetical protein
MLSEVKEQTVMVLVVSDTLERNEKEEDAW